MAWQLVVDAQPRDRFSAMDMKLRPIGIRVVECGYIYVHCVTRPIAVFVSHWRSTSTAEGSADAWRGPVLRRFVIDLRKAVAAKADMRHERSARAAPAAFAMAVHDRGHGPDRLEADRAAQATPGSYLLLRHIVISPDLLAPSRCGSPVKISPDQQKL